MSKDKNKDDLLNKNLKYSNNVVADKEEDDNSKSKYVEELSISNNSSVFKKVIYDKKIYKKKSITDLLLIFFKKTSQIPDFFSDFFSKSREAIFYSVLGTMVSFIFAILLFPENPGLFAIFFTTIFLAPFIWKKTNYNLVLFGRTKKHEEKGVSLTSFKIKEHKRFSLKYFYEENKEILGIYFYFFVGVMLVIVFLISIIPQESSSILFGKQGWNDSLIPSKEIGFENQNRGPLFFEILLNNFSVLLVCFIVALVFPLGATLMIVWNAMYWAVSFTQYAMYYSSLYTVNYLSILAPLLLSIILHTLLEAISYFFATMSGNLFSFSISKESLDSERFYYLLKYTLTLFLFAMVFLLIGTFVEVFLFDIIKSFFFGLF